jgi:hypothetical protein
MCIKAADRLIERCRSGSASPQRPYNSPGLELDDLQQGSGGSGRRALALCMRKRLCHGLHEFIAKFIHLRFLVALIAAANAVTALRCSDVNPGRH